jgi:exodeoxyribonuclease VII large subunit
MGVMLEDGMQVKAGGNPRVTKSYGSLGFWVDTIEPVGEGSLKKAYELLYKKLEAEGMFARKRQLPQFVRRVGLISSKGGVVVHDFMKNLASRGVKVYFIDSRVEGSAAVGQLKNAIESFGKNKHEVDVIVLARGGGSLESMLAFNNEEVCRAIYASPIPVIAGIGHEVDVPLACLVADASFSTPTATAVAVNHTWDALVGGLPVLKHKIYSAFARVFERYKILRDKILVAYSRTLEMQIDRLREIKRLVAFVDPARNLKLGYSIVRNEKGKVIKDNEDVEVGENISVKLFKGNIKSKIYEIER